MPILILRLIVMLMAGRSGFGTGAIGGTQICRASRNAMDLGKQQHPCDRDDQFRARHDGPSFTKIARSARQSNIAAPKQTSAPPRSSRMMATGQSALMYLPDSVYSK